MRGLRLGPVCDPRGYSRCNFISMFVQSFAFIATFTCRFVRSLPQRLRFHFLARFLAKSGSHKLSWYSWPIGLSKISLSLQKISLCHLHSPWTQLLIAIHLTVIVSVLLKVSVVVNSGRCYSQMRDVLEHSICPSSDESLEYTNDAVVNLTGEDSIISRSIPDQKTTHGSVRPHPSTSRTSRSP